MDLARRLRVTAFVLAAAVPLAVAPARARPPPPPRVPARAPPWLDGFDRSRDDLPRAVARLQRAGGLVIDIRFDGRAGHPGFDAALERGGRVRFVRLERGGGREVALNRRDQPPWIRAWRPRAQFAAALRAKVSLGAAVQQAETDAGNLPAVAASVATQAGDPLRFAPAYNVLVLTPDDAVRRVAVDARTGLSIADLGALAEWPQPAPP